MPNSMINKDAREGKGSKPALEKKWDKAKDASKKSTGKDDSWALTNYIYQKEKKAAAVTTNAASRLKATAIEADMQKSWAQKFHEGDKVVVVEPFVFDEGKKSQRRMPGVILKVGNSGTKERGVPGVVKFVYVVRTPFGEHTFEQDDLDKA